MRKLVSLALNDGISDRQLNEILCDQFGELCCDPDFHPQGTPISWSTRTEDEKLIIRVWPKDNGNTPHFHVERNGQRTDACICIETSDYFRHGVHQSTLTRDELKAVVLLLSKKVGDERTNWNRICDEWNKGTERARMVNCTIMPDYLSCGNV